MYIPGGLCARAGHAGLADAAHSKAGIMTNIRLVAPSPSERATLRQEWHERLRDTLLGAVVAVVPWVLAVVAHALVSGGL